MSENHVSNLIEKLSEFESRLVIDRKKRDEMKEKLHNACQQNMLLRDISIIEECLSEATRKVDYDLSMVSSLRQKIKRAAR